MERYLDYFREEHLDVLMQKKLFSGMTHDEIKSFIFFAKPLYVSSMRDRACSWSMSIST